MYKSNEQTNGFSVATNDPSRSAPAKAPFEVAFPDNYEPHHREAVLIRDFRVPAAISRIVGDDSLSTKGAATYFLMFYPDGKKPADPIENLLLEQLAICHQRSIALHLRADKEADPDKLAIYNTAAIRLGAEIRKLALAIKQYRQPSAPKNFAVIHQQNVATGSAGQQNVFIDKSTAENQDVSISSAQTKKEGQYDDAIGGRFNAQGEESTKGGSRKDQRLQTAAVE